MNVLRFPGCPDKDQSDSPAIDGEKADGAKRDGGAPSLHVSVLPPEGSGAPTREIKLDGRESWALDQLIRAGERGCTPIDNPGPRWSHYIFLLRRHGIVVETVQEKHAGPYAGNHGRYVLRSRVRVLKSAGLGGNPQERKALP